MLCRLSAEPRPDRQLRHRRALSLADEPWPASRDDCLSLADAGDSDAIPGAGIRRVEPVLLFCRSRVRAVAQCPRGAPPLPGAISQSRDERDAGRARRSRRHRHVSQIGARSRRTATACFDLCAASSPFGAAAHGPGAWTAAMPDRWCRTYGGSLDAALFLAERRRPFADCQSRPRPPAWPRTRAAAGTDRRPGLAALMVQRGTGLRWLRGPGAGCRRRLAHLGPKRQRPHPRLLSHDTRGEERLPSPRSEWLSCAAPAATRTRYRRLRVNGSWRTGWAVTPQRR